MNGFEVHGWELQVQPVAANAKQHFRASDGSGVLSDAATRRTTIVTQSLHGVEDCRGTFLSHPYWTSVTRRAHRTVINPTHIPREWRDSFSGCNGTRTSSSRLQMQSRKSSGLGEIRRQWWSSRTCTDSLESFQRSDDLLANILSCGRLREATITQVAELAHGLLYFRQSSLYFFIHAGKLGLDAVAGFLNGGAD